MDKKTALLWGLMVGGHGLTATGAAGLGVAATLAVDHEMKCGTQEKDLQQDAKESKVQEEYKPKWETRLPSDEEKIIINEALRREEMLRPMVKIMLINADPLFDEYGNTTENNNALIAELDDAGSRLVWYLENDRILIGIDGDREFNGQFHRGSRGKEDDLLFLNKKIERLRAGTLVHEAFHESAGHIDELNAYNSFEEGHWDRNARFGSLVIDGKDPAYTASIFYSIVEEPLMRLTMGKRDDESVAEYGADLEWQRNVKPEEFATIWTEWATNDRDAITAFGLTKTEIYEIYTSSAFREARAELLDEAISEYKAEYGRELSESKSEGRRSTRIEKRRATTEPMSYDLGDENRNLVSDEGPSPVQELKAQMRAEMERLEAEKAEREKSGEAIEVEGVWGELKEDENNENMAEMQEQEVGRERSKGLFKGRRK